MTKIKSAQAVGLFIFWVSLALMVSNATLPMDGTKWTVVALEFVFGSLALWILGSRD